MDEDKIFQRAKSILNEIDLILKKEFIFLESMGYGKQKEADLQQGLIKKDGIYVSYESVVHKILFDHYEVNLLETYIDLYKQLFQNYGETFAQFALRTLEEISFQKISILFDQDIPSNKKRKYKLLIWLADYASILKNKENEIAYNKLLEEHKNLLTEKELTFYRNLLTQIKTGTPVESYNLIKDARKKINPLQASLVSSIQVLSLVREINVLALSSSFSHILHGNVLLLRDILKFKRKNAQRLRIYWSLMLTGINVINRIGNNLNNYDLNLIVTKVNTDFQTFSDYINKNWRTIENIKE